MQYSNPAAYPPIEHGARLLANAGCKVRLLGLALLAEELRFAAHPAIDVKLLSVSRTGWRQKVHYVRFLAWVILQVCAFRPTWIYVSDPLAAPTGWLVSCVFRRPTIYHEHDAPLAGRQPASTFMRMVLGARRRLARRAAVCIVPNCERADAFREDTGRATVAIIWNTPLASDVVVSRDLASTGALKVFFHGSIVPARLPESLIDAVASSETDVIVQIAGYDPSGGAFIERLRQYARARGVEDRIVFLGAMPRARSLRACAECDVGLALLPLETDSFNEQTMIGASNKPFEYLACGLALLVSDRPEWRATFVDPGFGRACDPSSSESLAEALRWFANHRGDMRQMGERGRQRVAQTWHYEARFGPVLDMITGRHESRLSSAIPADRVR